MSLAAGKKKRTQGKPADPVCPCPVERLSVGGSPDLTPWSIGFHKAIVLSVRRRLDGART